MHDASKKLKSEGGHTIFGHQPGFLPAWLTGEEIYIVIASGMGSRLFSMRITLKPLLEGQFRATYLCQ